MRILRRKSLRDLWRIRWRALTVAVTVASGVGIYAGIGMAIATGYHTRDVLLGRMRFADLEVQFLPEDVLNLPGLDRIPGVIAIERRLVLPGTVFLADGGRIAGALVFLETIDPTLDALEAIEGGPIRAGDLESAVIERSLAAYHGFRVGDRIRMQVGEKTYVSRIDGVVNSPEYLISTANPDYFVPEKGSMGVIFSNLARVSDALGFTMVNDLLFRFEPGADPRATREAVVARLGKLNLERVVPKEEHFMWRFLQIEMQAFSVYTPCIVATLTLLSFVLTLITMGRLVLDQRREIGALLALGYRRAQVFRAYLGTGALEGTAGGLLGMVLAIVFRDLFARPYGSALGWPYIVTVVKPFFLVSGFVAAVIGTVAATAWPAWRMLRLPPQTIIREPVGDGTGLATWIRRMRTALGGPAAAGPVRTQEHAAPARPDAVVCPGHRILARRADRLHGVDDLGARDPPHRVRARAMGPRRRFSLPGPPRGPGADPRPAGGCPGRAVFPPLRHDRIRQPYRARRGPRDPAGQLHAAGVARGGTAPERPAG